MRITPIVLLKHAPNDDGSVSPNRVSVAGPVNDAYCCVYRGTLDGCIEALEHTLERLKIARAHAVKNGHEMPVDPEFRRIG